MNIEIFNLEVCFPNLGYEERVNRVNRDIKSLESMLITEVTDEGNPRANLKWIVEMFVSSFICRALSLASEACSSWNKGNGLASIILSRAIMETAAVAWKIEKEINKDLQKKDPKSIDLTLTTQMLGRIVCTNMEQALKNLLDIKEVLLTLEREHPFDKTKQGY